MFIVDPKGVAKWATRHDFPARRSRPKTAQQWYQEGLDSFEMGLYDGAVSLFVKAKKAGHPQAAKAIELCRERHATRY